MAQAKIISIGEMVATTTENILILFGKKSHIGFKRLCGDSRIYQ